MTVTYSSFVAEFTEFNDSSITALVTAKITEAQALHSSTAWGDLYDYAVKYTAADLIAMSPPGAEMAIRNSDGETVYSTLFKRYYRPRNTRRGIVL